MRTSASGSDRARPPPGTRRSRRRPGTSMANGREAVRRRRRRRVSPSHVAPARRSRAAGARCGRGWPRARARSCVPSACRPASRTAVFTCALGDRQASRSMPASGAAVDRQRAAGRPVVSMRAPIARSGAATRSTGRRRSDASPVEDRAERPRRPARPASMRRVEPELPASSGAGRRRAARSGPRPSTSTVGPRRRTATPTERFQAAQGRRAVAGGREVAESALAVGQGAQDGQAVGEDLSPGG